MRSRHIALGGLEGNNVNERIRIGKADSGCGPVHGTPLGADLPSGQEVGGSEGGSRRQSPSVPAPLATLELATAQCGWAGVLGP